MSNEKHVTLDQAFDSVNSKIQTNLFEIRSYCIEAQGIINNLVNANKSLKEENEKLRAEIEGLKNPPGKCKQKPEGRK